MGFVNPRARCPNCGAKIHTAPKGLGHLALFGRSSWMLQTGAECPYCGEALTGRVKPGGTAERMGEPEERAQVKAERRRDRQGSTEPLRGSGGPCDVTLTAVHGKKVPVITVLREFRKPSLALRHAKAMVDGAPTLVAVDCDPDEALSLAGELEAAGAEAKVKSGGPEGSELQAI
jgi:ribosomal protein L7/L12/DNA-directed RNA polymerase subunit RPC12/RpoP